MSSFDEISLEKTLRYAKAREERRAYVRANADCSRNGCWAAKGDPCLRVNGKPRRSNHKDREIRVPFLPGTPGFLDELRKGR